MHIDKQFGKLTIRLTLGEANSSSKYTQWMLFIGWDRREKAKVIYYRPWPCHKPHGPASGMLIAGINHRYYSRHWKGATYTEARGRDYYGSQYPGAIRAYDAAIACGKTVKQAMESADRIKAMEQAKRDKGPKPDPGRFIPKGRVLVLGGSGLSLDDIEEFGPAVLGGQTQVIFGTGPASSSDSDKQPTRSMTIEEIMNKYGGVIVNPPPGWNPPKENKKESRSDERG